MNTQQPTQRFLTCDDLAEMLGVCKQAIALMVKRGRLPEPIRLSRKTLRWDAREIEQALCREKLEAGRAN